MTKEEALNIIRNVFFHEDNQLNNDGQIGAKDIHTALTIACAALCEPSLPSDLDEAARKLYPYERGYDVDLPYPSTWDMNEDARNAFKAGAEWMASQFEKQSNPPCWKPTDDQMRALSVVGIEGAVSHKGKALLNELYNDLEKYLFNLKMTER